jgi:hypothetical protein
MEYLFVKYQVLGESLHPELKIAAKQHLVGALAHLSLFLENRLLPLHSECSRRFRSSLVIY